MEAASGCKGSQPADGRRRQGWFHGANSTAGTPTLAHGAKLRDAHQRMIVGGHTRMTCLRLAEVVGCNAEFEGARHCRTDDGPCSERGC